MPSPRHAGDGVRRGGRFLRAGLKASREHFRREEEMVFPLFEKLFDPAALEALGAGASGNASSLWPHGFEVTCAAYCGIRSIIISQPRRLRLPHAAIPAASAFAVTRRTLLPRTCRDRLVNSHAIDSPRTAPREDFPRHSPAHSRGFQETVFAAHDPAAAP